MFAGKPEGFEPLRFEQIEHFFLLTVEVHLQENRRLHKSNLEIPSKQ
jgi:hypothetical protein